MKIKKISLSEKLLNCITLQMGSNPQCCNIDFDDANYTFLVFDLVNLLKPFKDTFAWDTWDKFSINENVFDFNKVRKEEM